MQSFNGGDTATLRMTSLNGAEVQIFVEEEKSRDGETGHATEDVGFAALYDNPFSEPDGGDDAGEFVFEQGDG